MPNCLHRHTVAHCVRQPWFVRGRGYLGGSLYGRFVAQWLGVGFAREQFHFVPFERLTSSAPGETARVWDGVLHFLELPPFDSGSGGDGGADLANSVRSIVRTGASGGGAAAGAQFTNRNQRSSGAGHNMSEASYSAMVEV